MKIRAALLGAVLLVAGPAQAETWWTHEEIDEDFVPRIRIAPHIGVWAGEFDRTSRACQPAEFSPGFDDIENTPNISILPPEEVPPPGSPFCPTSGSDELALSAGVSAIYRALGPLHLSVGLDLALTFPDRDYLAGQFIVAIPIGLGLTHDFWTVRPIGTAMLTPYFSVPDLRRGFMWGGEWGLAWRVPDLAELQLVAGYHASEDWQMAIVRVSGFLP